MGHFGGTLGIKLVIVWGHFGGTLRVTLVHLDHLAGTLGSPGEYSWVTWGVHFSGYSSDTL